MTVIHFMLLQFTRPGDKYGLPIAVMLFDPSTDRLYVRGREDYSDIADAVDVEVLTETVKQIVAEVPGQSGQIFLESLESTLSNSILITDRIALRTSDIAVTLARLSTEFLR